MSGTVQLELALPAPDRAASLLASLRALGLAGVEQCSLTRNRAVLVSFGGGVLRVHEAFADAPVEVRRAIVAFVNGRGRAHREARRTLVRYPVPAPASPRRRTATQPADAPLVARLAEAHARLNAVHFDGALREVPIRVSRRMRSHLGHYRLPASAGGTGEIVISGRHIRRNGWTEALVTLLHEMVHQWQHEQGLPVDHGPAFREKAREVGIPPRATRPRDGVFPRLAAMVRSAWGD